MRSKQVASENSDLRCSKILTSMILVMYSTPVPRENPLNWKGILTENDEFCSEWYPSVEPQPFSSKVFQRFPSFWGIKMHLRSWHVMQSKSQGVSHPIAYKPPQYGMRELQSSAATEASPVDSLDIPDLWQVPNSLHHMSPHRWGDVEPAECPGKSHRCCRCWGGTSARSVQAQEDAAMPK